MIWTDTYVNMLMTRLRCGGFVLNFIHTMYIVSSHVIALWLHANNCSNDNDRARINNTCSIHLMKKPLDRQYYKTSDDETIYQ
jgi:hypothetical protein